MALSPEYIAAAVIVSQSGGDLRSFIMCQRKKKFATLAEAVQFALPIAPKKERTFKFRAYLCPDCRNYHLAHVAAKPLPPQPKAKQKHGIAMTPTTLIQEYQSRADKAVQETLRARRELAEEKAKKCQRWCCRLRERLAKGAK